MPSLPRPRGYRQFGPQAPSKHEFAARDIRPNGQFALHQFRTANDRDGSKTAAAAVQYWLPLSLNRRTIPTRKLSRSMSLMDDAAGTATHTRSRAACAFSRMAESDIAGVSASGSTLTCRIAGRPELRAASKAGKKSAVRSTVVPWPPKARA